jgi:ceramide glucosyltransferase
MTWTVVRWLVLILACAPFVYYLLCIYAALRFFLEKPRYPPSPAFAPPVSILKPVRGLDPEAYESFLSFCQLDYPEYEVLFGVTDADDPVIPIIQKLIENNPGRSIRLLVGAEKLGANSKVCKLVRLVREARYDLFVIGDSDVRVAPDYLRAVVAAFRDPQVGGVTTLFRGTASHQLGSDMECVGFSSEFCGGVLVARLLEGMKFTLGATMATTRQRLAEIGGFEALADCHSDDFELGNRIAARGYRIEMIPYTVWMVFPAHTVGGYLRHELRWAIGLRNIRPWGHAGLVFTHGLVWSLAAAAVAPSKAVAIGYVVSYLVLRLLMAWVIGVWGLKDPVLRRRLWLVPLRDAVAFLIWLASFASNRIQWRGLKFTIRKGRLTPFEPRNRRG